MSLLMSLRMVASVGVIPLAVALTPSTQIVSLVSGTFRLSPAYTCVLITALRFIPTFGERMGKVLEAEACRATAPTPPTPSVKSHDPPTLPSPPRHLRPRRRLAGALPRGPRLQPRFEDPTRGHKTRWLRTRRARVRGGGNGVIVVVMRI